MAVKQSRGKRNLNLIDAYVGTAYDNVVVVAANIDAVKQVAVGMNINLKYLGAADTPPTTRLDGSPLEDGDYYLHSATDALRYYDLAGTRWLQLTLSAV